MVFRFGHIGEACHHLGRLLPIVLAGDEEGIQILTDKRKYIAFGAVPAEEHLGTPVVGMADDDGVTFFPSVT